MKSLNLKSLFTGCQKQTFHKVVYYISCILKIDEDIKTILIYWTNWNLYKFCNISVNFKDTKMVDHILKISRPGVFDKRYLSWNTAIIVFMKKFATWTEDDIYIPMFFGTPCRSIFGIYWNNNFLLLWLVFIEFYIVIISWRIEKF